MCVCVGLRGVPAQAASAVGRRWPAGGAWRGVRHVTAITRVSGLWRLFPPRCVPVFLEAETADHFYNGYCNNVLWPLLHYIPLSMLDAQAQLTETQWAAYQRANKDFADTVPPPCSPTPSRRQACVAAERGAASRLTLSPRPPTHRVRSCRSSRTRTTWCGCRTTT